MILWVRSRISRSRGVLFDRCVTWFCSGHLSSPSSHGSYWRPLQGGGPGSHEDHQSQSQLHQVTHSRYDIVFNFTDNIGISLPAVAYLVFQKGANFCWPLVLTQRRGQTEFSQFFLWWQTNFCQRGHGPITPPPPLNTPLVTRCLTNHRFNFEPTSIVLSSIQHIFTYYSSDFKRRYICV